MRRLLRVALLMLSLGGCATYPETRTPVVSVANQQESTQKLSTALQELKQDKPTAAIAILEELVAEPGVKGVTDEALFRLSMLNLFQEEKDGLLTSTRYLERLRREYSDSSWTQQARPLMELLNNVNELKKQNRSLKNANNNLAKENKELQQNIKRLKNLDLQLERKTR